LSVGLYRWPATQHIMVLECSKRDGSGLKNRSFKEFITSNGTIIGVFQGSYGAQPELDILVKYQEPHKKIRTPQHIHWAIDLLIKKEHNPELTKEFIRYLTSIWSGVEPFKSKAEQQLCQLKFSNPDNLKKFEPLNEYGEYPVDFIGTVIELLMLEEKTGHHAAFMFKGVLDALNRDEDIFTIVQRATFRGS
jgi:hypothetical protein